ncbi:hypothetical protein EGW08_012106 [Elysia chlorotica]|uniref:Ig-like domain-containing protein n=1 Tax=Elysia chlorotica TaxID=188477 RepID=A0A433TEW5_ELYCH|nr:hypothetical protein EGW08_012106 [Elysia chlorotica]
MGANVMISRFRVIGCVYMREGGEKMSQASTTILFLKGVRFEAADRLYVINRYDLVITDVRREDNGQYACRTKDAGIQTATLTVLYSPFIAFRPYSPVYAVRLGEPAELTCDVDSNPQVSSVRWSKDGVNLSGTNPFLRFSPAGKADSGEYTCTATNSIGEKSGKLRVDVQYPPIVTTKPSVVVTEGDDVTITCEVDSNPPPYEVQWSRERASGSSHIYIIHNCYPEATYRWTKDGQALSETRQTLTIASVSLLDNGRYSCTPSNSQGSGLAASVQVNVFDPPIVTTMPSVVVTEGDDVTITCEVDSNPPPYEVQWSRERASGSSQTLVTNATLTLRSVRRDQAGNFSCWAQNQLKLSGKREEFRDGRAFSFLYVQCEFGSRATLP